MGNPSAFPSLSTFVRQDLRPVECPICQEDFGAERQVDPNPGILTLLAISSRDTVVETPCNHRFHRGCLLTWVLGQRKEACPYCKHVLFIAPTITEYKEEEAAEQRQSELDALRLLRMNANPAERQNLLNPIEEQNINAEEINTYFQVMWSAIQRELGRVSPDDLNHPFARAKARALMLEMENKSMARYVWLKP